MGVLATGSGQPHSRAVAQPSRLSDGGPLVVREARQGRDPRRPPAGKLLSLGALLAAQVLGRLPCRQTIPATALRKEGGAELGTPVGGG